MNSIVCFRFPLNRSEMYNNIQRRSTLTYTAIDNNMRSAFCGLVIFCYRVTRIMLWYFRNRRCSIRFNYNIIVVHILRARPLYYLRPVDKFTRVSTPVTISSCIMIKKLAPPCSARYYSYTVADLRGWESTG